MPVGERPQGKPSAQRRQPMYINNRPRCWPRRPDRESTDYKYAVPAIKPHAAQWRLRFFFFAVNFPFWLNPRRCLPSTAFWIKRGPVTFSLSFPFCPPPGTRFHFLSRIRFSSVFVHRCSTTFANSGCSTHNDRLRARNILMCDASAENRPSERPQYIFNHMPHGPDNKN